MEQKIGKFFIKSINNYIIKYECNQKILFYLR